MAYYIDLKEISIEQYKKKLKSTNFLPSWKILAENIDENMDTIKKLKIKNVEELKHALKTKINVSEFSKLSGLSEEYLTVLRRVINGYHPKPNKIKDFPSISKKTILALENVGIKNTFHLFDKIKNPQSRKTLAKKTKISENIILHLAKLTDLSRVKWVNHTFANVLLLAGFESAKKVAEADPLDLYERVKKLNEEKKLFPAHIGMNDMKRCIDAANDLTFEVEY